MRAKVSRGLRINNAYKSSLFQKGGIYSSILIAAMFGMCLITALKLAPSYIDNKTIRNTIETIDENDGLANLSIVEIRQSLSKTLITNGIRDFNTGTVVLTRERGEDYIDVVYEKRIPIAYNVEAIVSFNERFDLQ